MKVISLGQACQVAHQLKRIGITEQTNFFDWIVSPHEVLIKNLHLNLDSLLFSKGVVFNGKRTHLRDVATGFWFYGHDFSGVENRTGIVTDEELAKIKEKYLRRSRRTRIALSEGPVTVVRHFYETPVAQAVAEQRQLVETLESLYPRTEFSYLWASELPVDCEMHTRGSVVHTPKGNDWKGDDQAWDRVATLLGN
ncbi:DUF1796 family putative cysteine peptidase [Sinorhizobium meliloti]|uniref:DUF1796 family putative cysteine peptidase n=1 Tax=Rhizobium meliloti TaxID=382 RepID=UPI000FD24EFA|nr:DUF1796 family putative cysteine peptidase [Sinorhizobium meliloti]MDW9633603.1 hypothetical protein [Sinorhizobium meliloti]RVJ90027.1 hypothetical protein CN173_24400 [Sinorhizobium meliloti]